MKHLLPLLLLSLLFTSCGKTIYNETHSFKDNTWMRFEAEEFTINVPSEEDYYNIEMTICLDTNIFKEKEFPLVVNMISSEGEQRMFDAHIPLFNFKEGGRIGTFEETFQTSSNLVRKYLSFNRKGDFKLQIKQGTSKYELHGIKSIGVKVVKADMELPK